MSTPPDPPAPRRDDAADTVEWLPGHGPQRLALHDLGGAGAPLLLVHATGLHGRVWDPVAAHLRSFHCHALDLRGHGRSELPDGDPLDWAGFGRDAAVATDHLGPGLVGVGHSLGAVALLMAAAEQPGRFGALVLHEPAMRATTGELPADLLELQRLMVTMTRARRAVFPSRPVALASYARKPPYAGVLASSLLAYVDHGFVDTPDGQVTLRCAPEVEARIFATTHDHDLAQRLGDITCPVYVVLGDETSPEQRRGSAELAEIFGIPARVLDGADHFGPLAQPSRFAAVVREAVAAAGLPTAAGVIT